MKRYIKQFIMVALFLLAGAYIIGYTWFPIQTKNLIPYRFYTILTNSMEPCIPTFSLVCVKNINDPTQLVAEEIITFQIERLKEKEVLTHRFAYRENVDGTMYYRTHPQTSDALDPYDVQESDLIGTYVFHIPYVGKLILFITGPFGLFSIGIGICILIGYHYVNEHYDMEEEITLRNVYIHHKQSAKGYVVFEDIQIRLDATYMEVEGLLSNETNKALRYIKVCFIFYNRQKECIGSHTFYANDKETLLPQQAIRFHFMIERIQDIHDYQISIVSMRIS